MPREIITLQCTECKNRNYYEHEEQEDHDGAAGAEEVLPVIAASTSAHKEIK